MNTIVMAKQFAQRLQESHISVNTISYFKRANNINHIGFEDSDAFVSWLCACEIRNIYCVCIHPDTEEKDCHAPIKEKSISLDSFINEDYSYTSSLLSYTIPRDSLKSYLNDKMRVAQANFPFLSEDFFNSIHAEFTRRCQEAITLVNRAIECIDHNRPNSYQDTLIYYAVHDNILATYIIDEPNEVQDSDQETCDVDNIGDFIQRKRGMVRDWITETLSISHYSPEVIMFGEHNLRAQKEMVASRAVSMRWDGLTKTEQAKQVDELYYLVNPDGRKGRFYVSKQDVRHYLLSCGLIS